jgi:Sulfotransferase domain
MIVWLASYPRSGNTLLRTILKQTMHLGSYSDEVMLPSVGHTEASKQEYGNLTYDGSWENFYNLASNSKDIFFVKTHLPPKDNQPVIYVVRDGRAATESYVSYHASFIKQQHPASIMSLMLGDDYYGDWSTHFQLWSTRKEGRLLLVKFDELVHANNSLLEKLNQFIGLDINVISFENPIHKLQQENPNFFRTGNTTWQPSALWTPLEENLFLALHGDLLVNLGYIDQSKRDDALKKLEPTTTILADFAKRGFKDRNFWQYESYCKEKIIQQLVDEKSESNKPSFHKDKFAAIFGLRRHS